MRAVEAHVGDGRGYPFPGDDGGWPPQTGGPHGPASGRRRPVVALSDVRRQHDRVSRTLRTHRAREASLPRRVPHEDRQSAALRLLLLLETAHR